VSSHALDLAVSAKSSSSSVLSGLERELSALEPSCNKRLKTFFFILFYKKKLVSKRFFLFFYLRSFISKKR